MDDEVYEATRGRDGEQNLCTIRKYTHVISGCENGGMITTYPSTELPHILGWVPYRKPLSRIHFEVQIR